MKRLKLRVEKALQHREMCDASAAIAVNQDHFAVANDEDNILRVYRSGQSGGPVALFAGTDLNGYFGNNPQKKEVDIEAAAELDGIIYWITSHGRNKKGEFRPERRQFFANKIVTNEDGRAFKQVGHSYSRIFEDMLKDERLKSCRLDAAENLPPKAEGGLNIEGLAAAPDHTLLIGFRNPIPEGKALLLPLANPKELIKDTGAKAIFGDPIELDLDGLGIRSIEYWQSQNRYLIVAGAYDGGKRFALYHWSGLRDENPEPIEAAGMPPDFRPESVLFYPDKENSLQLLSDDGSIERLPGIPCKDIKNQEHPQKYFRSLWLRVDRA